MDINISGFIPALLPVALSPGASFTLAINSALAGGMRGMIRTLAGTALGIYTHALLIGLGLTAVLVKSPAIFNAVTIAGAAWLLWLGITLIHSGLTAKEMTFDDSRGGVSLKEAWIANVFNPKAILFYLTVVSQFAGSDGEVGDYLALASVHVLVMGVWLLAISKALVFSSRKANGRKLKLIVNTAGGLLLVVLSLNSLIQ